MASSHCTGSGLEQVQGMELGLVGQEQDQLSPIVPVPFPVPVKVPISCSVNGRDMTYVSPTVHEKTFVK